MKSLALALFALLLIATPGFAQEQGGNDTEVAYKLTDKHIQNFSNFMKEMAVWSKTKEREVERRAEDAEGENYQQALDDLSSLVASYGGEMQGMITRNGFSDEEHLADVSSRIVSALMAVALEDQQKVSEDEMSKSIEEMRAEGASEAQIDMIKSLASGLQSVISELAKEIPADDIAVVRKNQKLLEEALDYKY